MFYSLQDIQSLLQKFKLLNIEIAEELRGWNWKSAPLLSTFENLINVSDIASINCDTNRFVYMKYILKAKKEEGLDLRIGALTHKLYSLAHQTARSLIYDEIIDPSKFYEAFISMKPSIKFEPKEIGSKITNAIWERAAHAFASNLSKAISRSIHLNIDSIASLTVPVMTEVSLDGYLLGFNRSVRIDGYAPPNLIIELKTGKLRESAEIGLAAYAVIFECIYCCPVNAGLLVNVVFDKGYENFQVFEKFLIIGDNLRTKLIERRDDALKIISEKIDPGLPEYCDPKCPYLKTCGNEKIYD